MNSDYSRYLLSIIFIVVVISGGLVFFLVKGRSGYKKSSPLQPVKNGSISVFFDRTGSVTIIPYVKDKFGVGKATADVVFIKAPYAPEKLGGLVRVSMNRCENAVPCEDKTLFDMLGAADWTAFSEGKRNISVVFKEKYGILINTTRRKSDGAYQFTHTGVEKALPPSTDDLVLGSTLLQLLQRCRC